MAMESLTVAIERYAHAKYALDNYPGCDVTCGDDRCYDCNNCRVHASLQDCVSRAANELRAVA